MTKLSQKLLESEPTSAGDQAKCVIREGMEEDGREIASEVSYPGKWGFALNKARRAAMASGFDGPCTIEFYGGNSPLGAAPGNTLDDASESARGFLWELRRKLRS